MSPPAQHPPTASPRYRSHDAGSLDEQHVGAAVRVAGFVHNKRELGGLVFVELRDPSGVVQCVLTRDNLAFEQARSLALESVVSIDGEVVQRTAGSRNDKLHSGAVELRVSSIELLSQAEALPFAVRDHVDVPEELRLKYRFLDLRRTRVRDNIVLRSRVVARLRELLTQRGFLEVQTPILTASSPEGARDFLVPSRLSPGKFYALPQAPQLFKQLLMVGGFLPADTIGTGRVVGGAEFRSPRAARRAGPQARRRPPGCFVVADGSRFAKAATTDSPDARGP